MSKSDVFHLGLTKNDLQGATLAIVPGDPERVEKIAALMDKPVDGRRKVTILDEFVKPLIGQAGQLSDKCHVDHLVIHQ